MSRPRNTYDIVLDEDEQRALSKLAVEGSETERIRCNIIALLDAGWDCYGTAAFTGASVQTCNNAARAFLEHGVEGLKNPPRRKKEKEPTEIFTELAKVMSKIAPSSVGFTHLNGRWTTPALHAHMCKCIGEAVPESWVPRVMEDMGYHENEDGLWVE